MHRPKLSPTGLFWLAYLGIVIAGLLWGLGAC